MGEMSGIVFTVKCFVSRWLQNTDDKPVPPYVQPGSVTGVHLSVTAEEQLPGQCAAGIGCHKVLHKGVWHIVTTSFTPPSALYQLLHQPISTHPLLKVSTYEMDAGDIFSEVEAFPAELRLHWDCRKYSVIKR